MCTPRQAHAVVKSPSAVKLFVLCPLRAGRFVGVHTSSRSFVSRSNRLALATRKSDTVFRMELACLCPAWGSLSSSVLGGDRRRVESRSRRSVRDLIRQRKAATCMHPEPVHTCGRLLRWRGRRRRGEARSRGEGEARGRGEGEARS